MPTRNVRSAHAPRRTPLFNHPTQPRSRRHSPRHRTKSRRRRANLDPALTRSILANFLLNLSEYEIASVQVLSQRLELLEQLETAPAQARRRKNRAHLRNKQNFLLAAKHFLRAMTSRLETEHKKLEALVTSLKTR